MNLTDSDERCRGMLAQPKLLVTAPEQSPSLEWWPGLNAWLGETSLTESATTLRILAVGESSCSPHCATRAVPVWTVESEGRTSHPRPPTRHGPRRRLGRLARPADALTARGPARRTTPPAAGTGSTAGPATGGAGGSGQVS
ncbi:MULTISPECIES: hypothetical protein [unclassified Streptomyces]|uniref:hypothetical protein n=1 Tax=unclassified Streptomyces TaxID=2593676 RepID=UPI0036EF437D